MTSAVKDVERARVESFRPRAGSPLGVHHNDEPIVAGKYGARVIRMRSTAIACPFCESRLEAADVLVAYRTVTDSVGPRHAFIGHAIPNTHALLRCTGAGCDGRFTVPRVELSR